MVQNVVKWCENGEEKEEICGYVVVIEWFASEMSGGCVVRISFMS